MQLQNCPYRQQRFVLSAEYNGMIACIRSVLTLHKSCTACYGYPAPCGPRARVSAAALQLSPGFQQLPCNSRPGFSSCPATLARVSAATLQLSPGFQQLPCNSQLLPWRLWACICFVLILSWDACWNCSKLFVHGDSKIGWSSVIYHSSRALIVWLVQVIGRDSFKSIFWRIP